MIRARAPRLVVIGLIGLATAIVCLWIDAHSLLRVYLATTVAVSSIPVGAIGVLMVTYLVRGNWTDGLHVPLTAAALTVPATGVLFIPLLVGVSWLYPWAHGTAGDAGSFKAVWLTPWFFTGRTVLYFVAWWVLAVWLRRAWADPRRMVISASAGLIVFALTASLAGIDWCESLTPEFHSSIYGLLFVTFQLLAGLAFALVVALWQFGAPTFRYGAILFSVLLLWAYNHAMQYIIIWAGNIPEEVVWYLHRESGGWGIMFWALVILQFILPFFAMLLSRVRNVRRTLLAVAVLTLALRFLEAYVLVLPGSETGLVLWLAAPGTIALCGALWWLVFMIVFERVQSTIADTRPLADGFDASGSPVPAAPARS